jgi:hypothetical protein
MTGATPWETAALATSSDAGYVVKSTTTSGFVSANSVMASS